MIQQRRLLPTFLLCAAALFLRCGGDQLVNEGGGGSEVVGVLVDPHGDPVAGAIVRVKIAATDSAGTGAIIDSVRTDDTGAYVIDSLDSNTYNLYGDFNDSELVIFIPGVVYDSGLLDLGTDTMHAPGKIGGTVIVDEVDRSGILIYIPGTSFSARTDSAGSFVMTGVPPGVYAVRIEYTGYLDALVQGIAVVSGGVANMLTVTMAHDPALLPPAPTGLSARYDTASGIVSLSWEPVDVSDLAGYLVYLSPADVLPTELSDSTVTQSAYRDAVFQDLFDTASYQRTYQVKSVDLNHNLSTDFSEPVTVTAVSPTWIRTFFDTSWVFNPATDSVIDPDSVRLSDSTGIVVHFTNRTRPNYRITWATDQPTHVVRQVNLSPVLAGYDTLRFAWSDSGFHDIILSVLDGAGTTWKDTIRVGVRDVIPRNTWLLADSLRVARRLPAACAMGEKIYVTGGYQTRMYFNGDSIAYSDSVIRVAEVYDRAADRWDTIASPPTMRRFHAMAAANGKAYVFGGNGRRPGSILLKSFTTIEVYDTATRAWTTAGTQLPASRGKLAAVAVGGKIYLIGGANDSGQCSGSIDEYDPVAGTITHRADLIAARAGHQAVYMDGLIYVAGGLDGSAILSSVETFDPVSGEVNAIAPLYESRSNFSLAAVGGKLFACGGFDPETMDAPIGSIEVFDPGVGVWASASSNLPVARQAMSTVSVSGAIYLVGGSDSGCGAWRTTAPAATRAVEVYYP